MDLNVSQFLSPGRKEFVKGTLLLTGAGLFCRILGFFYRIYMSRTIGAEGLGLYNMIHPFFSIAFALCAGSIQTALSQYVAANREKGWSVFLCGLALSLSLSVIPVLLLCKGKIFLASNVLSEPQAARYLPVLAVSVPFACLHACINGYYYGMNKAHIPSFSQIAEQMIRMGAVWLLVIYLEKNGKPVTVGLAVEGHVIGEMASAAFTFLALLLVPPQKGEREGGKERKNLVPILTLALPLMGNRLVLNLLSSAEAIWIPSRLVLSGLTSREAFELYGVLTGMALPFIFFPSAISNSMAVILLPAVAGAQADGREHHIREAVLTSLRYSLYMGILCIGVFTCFGDFLGNIVFHESSAGYFMKVLAWLCPFLYLATTTGSILNGLGKTSAVFLQNTAALSLRLAFVFFGIPRFGIHGCLWGMLASELFLSAMHLYTLKGLVSFSIQPWDMILKPTLYLLISVGICRYALPSVSWFHRFPAFFTVLIQIFLLPSCYIGLLALSHFSRQRTAALNS